MDVGVRDTQELMYRPRAILSTANIAMPNSTKCLYTFPHLYNATPYYTCNNLLKNMIFLVKRIITYKFLKDFVFYILTLIHY